MKKYIYLEYSMQDRVKMLQKLSSKSEVKTYNRTLSQREVDLEKDKYTSDAIELERQKAELKATAERLKAGITSVENLMIERLERIKTGQMQTTATVYGLVDTAEFRMRFYDNYGEEIYNRELTPDERQGKLFIGDDPLGTPRAVEDVEHVVIEPGDDDNALKTAVDAMYADEPGMVANVDVEVKAPREDKPAKKASKKKGKKDDEEKPL